MVNSLKMIFLVIRRQWMSAIGQRVIGHEVEKAELMGKLADDVVKFTSKLIKDNATLFQELCLGESKANNNANSSFNGSAKSAPEYSTSAGSSGVQNRSAPPRSEAGEDPKKRARGGVKNRRQGNKDDDARVSFHIVFLFLGERVQRKRRVVGEKKVKQRDHRKFIDVKDRLIFVKYALYAKNVIFEG